MSATPRGRATAVTVIVAVVLFADIRLGGLKTAELSLAVVAAAGLIALSARYPGIALCLILGYVPLQMTLLSWCYKHGLPASLAKDLGYVKDATVGGIVIAALLRPRAHAHSRPHHRWSLDFLDKCAFVYVGIATIYLLLPMLAPSALGGQTFHVRLNAWRIDCLFVVLMVAARRIEFSARALRAARAVVVAVAVILFVVGVWEAISSSAYNHFLQSTIGLPSYQIHVLNVQPPAYANYVIYTDVAGLKVQRVGSLFTDSLELGFFMLIPLGLCVERLGIRRPSFTALAGLGAAITTIILAETRSAMLGAAVAIVLAVRLAFRDHAPGRYRLAGLVALAAVIAVPMGANTVLQHRLFSSFSSTPNQDNAGHVYSSSSAVKDIIHTPQGKGLGTNPATGQRFSTSNLKVSENSYLQVGTELGVVGMLAFVAMFLALLSRLRLETRRRSEQGSAASGIWLAGWALFVCGFFLHVWTLFTVSLAFWGLAGASIGPPARAGVAHAKPT